LGVSDLVICTSVDIAAAAAVAVVPITLDIKSIFNSLDKQQQLFFAKKLRIFQFYRNNNYRVCHGFRLRNGARLLYFVTYDHF